MLGINALYKLLGLPMSGYALALGAFQDLAHRTVSRWSLFLLYGLGVLQGLEMKKFILWLLLMGYGAFLEQRERVPLGEGDVYVIAGLALFHPPIELLVIVTLAVWLLCPLTLYALWLKRKGQPYELPFVPSLLVARQTVLLVSVLI